MKQLTLVLFAAGLFAQQPQAAKPETVMVTYHAKPGAEEDLARVLARQWATVRGLDLVVDSPHVMVLGADKSGKTYFVEIWTWRDENVPDHAPAAIQALWAELRKLVEPRNGRPGIDVTEVSVVQ